MRETFDRDGAVHVADILDGDTCARAHRAIDACRSDPGEHYAMLSKPGGAQVDSDLFRWFDQPELREVLFGGPLPQLAATLLGTDAVVFVEDQWFASAPAADTASPWHQDEPYYNIDGAFVTIWIALDPAPAGAALRVVPGSHRWGRSFAPVEFAESMSTIGGTGGLEPVPPTDVLDNESIGWPVRAGDAIALHPATLHCAGKQPVPDRWFRRLSTRWAAPDARYVDRGEQAATFWAKLPHGLRTGDALACDVFPLVTL